MATAKRTWRIGLLALAIALVGGAVGGAITLTQEAQPSKPTRPAAPPPSPLMVAALSPAAGSSLAAPASPITVHFSKALARGSPAPTLIPALAGTWTRPDPATFEFLPQSLPVPDQVITLDVPDGPGGVRAADGGVLTAPVTASWTAPAGSVLRLQQLLASLGYLPVTFQAVAPVTPTASTETAAAYTPPAGSFPWRWGAVPPRLAAQWQPGSYGPMTRGAVMAFEAAHGLAADGDAGPLVWSALINAAVAGGPIAPGYSWVYVSEGHPEVLALWHNGAVALLSHANTGVPQAPTPTGTWAVYARYPATTMSGINPDGTHYVDHGVPFVNYFDGGDAVHGFLRSQYGFPQSVGCVELPLAAAQRVYGLLYVGALVTVTA